MLRYNTKIISLGQRINITGFTSRLFSLTNANLDKFANSESVQINEEELNSQIKQVNTNQTRPLKNQPFVKNLFCGRYEYDYLKFPEYDTNSKVEQLTNDYVRPVVNYFDSNANDQVDHDGNFDKMAMENFKKLGLFANSFPKEFGGEELDATGVTRVIEETGKLPSLGMSLIYNNEMAGKAILLHASKEKKEKYLRRIASGELKASFCYSEFENGVDEINFNTISKYNAEEKVYTLNGKKSWVSLISTNKETTASNEEEAVFVLIAKSIDESDPDNSTLNAFLVEKNTPGVKLTKQLSNFNGLNLYAVEFENLKLTESDMLGVNGSGHEICTKLSENARYLVGAICTGLLKDLFKKTVDFVNNSRRFDKSISDFEFVRDRIADIETKLYTMESMTYMTAGIIDSYEIPDVACETALTKIYCTETLRTCVNSCLEIFAMGSYSQLGDVQNNYLQDLNYLSNMFTSNDYLRLYVATSGTVLAGTEFSDQLVKLKNPFLNPGYALKKMYGNYQLSRSVNKKAPEYLYLWEHVHPSLNEPVAILEQCTVKFMMTIKYALLTHGRDAVEVQYSMKHLANIAMHLYALNSIIARASRAYSIGLHNAQHEIGLCFLQANHSNRAITEAFDEIVKARIGQGQDNIKNTVSENVFKAAKHAATHSIERNY